VCLPSVHRRARAHTHTHTHTHTYMYTYVYITDVNACTHTCSVLFARTNNQRKVSVFFNERGGRWEVISHIHAHTQTVYQFLTDPEHKASIDTWASEVVNTVVKTRSKNMQCIYSLSNSKRIQ
jgi:hypothetical protein